MSKLIVPKSAQGKKTIISDKGVPLTSKGVPVNPPSTVLMGFIFVNKITGEEEFAGTAIVPFSAFQKAAKQAELGSNDEAEALQYNVLFNVYTMYKVGQDPAEKERLLNLKPVEIFAEINEKYSVMIQPVQVAHVIVDMGSLFGGDEGDRPNSDEPSNKSTN